MAYTSIVDYLNAKGQKSDYATRAKLASQNGISGYQGTAAQNTQLLGLLQTPKTPTYGPTAPTAPLTSGVNLNFSGGLPSTPNSGTNLANNFMSSYLKNPFPGVNNNTNSLFSVSGNLKNGVTGNGAGFQVPGATTPTPTPKISSGFTSVMNSEPNNIYSNTPNTEFGGTTVDPSVSKAFFDNASRASNPSPSNIPDVIPTNNLSSSQGYSIPETPGPSMDFNALLKSIQTSNTTSSTANLDKQIADMMNPNSGAGLMDQQKNILDLTGEIAGRDKAQFNAEKTAGVFDFQKQLNDVNSQINQLQKENEITKLNAQGQAIPQEEINKQTADSDRRYAVKALGLSAIAQTIQGNLALAQDYATKSVEAEFAPLESQLEYLKLALEYNKENFTREEKKRSEQLALMIDQREQLLAEEKDNKKSVFSIMQSAVEAGADAKTLNAIINSKTPEEALIAGASAFQITGGDLSNAKVFGDSTGGYFRLDQYGNAIPLSQGVGKPATSDQYKVAGFAERIGNSKNIIDDLEQKMYYSGLLGTTASAIQSVLPNWMKSDERQQMEQAQRDFINAVLRRESGAAIAPTEFESAALQYFPQPGDSQPTLDQKRKNRDIVLNSLQREAGPALSSPGSNSISQAFDSYGFNSAPGTALNGLGTLSEKYESGGNPGAIGYDSTGGYSYGAFQLAHNNAKSFVDQSPYQQYFQNKPFNSQEWRNTWKQVASQDPEGFYNAQKAYIAKTHYEPLIAKLQSGGINTMVFSPAVLNAIWSTSVQHGPNTNIIAKAISELPPQATEADLLKQIYKDRWAGGANFASSTPAVKNAVYNRYFGPNGELNTALSMLT